MTAMMIFLDRLMFGPYVVGGGSVLGIVAAFDERIASVG